MSEVTGYGYNDPEVEERFRDTYMENVYAGNQVAMNAARFAASMKQRALERNDTAWNGAFEQPDQMVWETPELSNN